MIVSGPGQLIYYDGLAKILEAVGLHDVVEALLKKKSDAGKYDYSHTAIHGL